MRIEESVVRLESSRDYARQYALETESRVSFGGILKGMRAAPPDAATEPLSGEESEGRVRMMLQQLVATIIEMLTGEKCRCQVDEIAAEPEGKNRAGNSNTPEGTTSASGRLPMRTLEWQTRVVEQIEELEQTQFSSEGKVRTADGKEIDFTLSLSMCREFSCTRELVESGRVVFRDPLVINFDGQAAELTDARFDFDLDADGSKESLPTLMQGSGYLAFDANKDGCINDGRELFGACSGDGFADLAEFDVDSNGWIDENDPLFAALGVWFPDGQLKPLRETGVGALYLGSAATDFSLNDADNNARGQIRRSGIYLNEDGSAGSLQQLDLALATTGRTAETAEDKGAERGAKTGTEAGTEAGANKPGRS